MENMELKIKNVNTTTSSDGSQYGKFVIEPLERGEVMVQQLVTL